LATEIFEEIIFLLYCQEQMDMVGESVRQLITTATYEEGKESDTF
jgi:hypothetical protein